MPRSRRIIYPGYPHHITHRGNGGQVIFFNEGDKQYYLSLLAHYSATFDCRILGYCLMMNHVHLVITPDEYDNLGRCMHGVAFSYARRFNKINQRGGHLWENRYYSCPVDTDEHLWRVMRYVYRNPVKAGIVSIPWDYRWSSANADCNGSTSPDLKLEEWLDPANKNAYRDYLLWNEDPGLIQLATKRGTPFGNFNGFK